MWLKIEGATAKERFYASLDHTHRTAVIYNMRFGKDKTVYSEIAKVFEISPERVRFLSNRVSIDMLEQQDLNH